MTTQHSHSVVFRKRAGQRLAAEHSEAFRRHSYVNVTLRLHNVVRLVVRKNIVNINRAGRPHGKTTIFQL